MAARSSWKGYLKLSLISVPIKAYTATASGGAEIHLNQIHAPCNSRIQYKKVCPIHGEVKSDEIVSGYEFSKGQYVLVDTDELDKLRTQDDKAIKIDTFIAPDMVDPIYLEDKTYYLVPDGPVGQRPYAVLQEAMVEKNRYALAQVVFSGKEKLVLVRPLDRFLVMTMLALDQEVTKPAAFEGEVPKVEYAKEELDLAKTLVDASTTKKLDYAKYRDLYTERLTQLIEAKVQGKELVTPPVQEQAQVINLMDALKQSVAQLHKEVAVAKPPKKMAKSVAPKKVETRKKKTS